MYTLTESKPHRAAIDRGPVQQEFFASLVMDCQAALISGDAPAAIQTFLKAKGLLAQLTGNFARMATSGQQGPEMEAISGQHGKIAALCTALKLKIKGKTWPIEAAGLVAQTAAGLVAQTAAGLVAQTAAA